MDPVCPERAREIDSSPILNVARSFVVRSPPNVRLNASANPFIIVLSSNLSRLS